MYLPPTIPDTEISCLPSGEELEYFALIEEANRLGLPVAGHVPVEVRASEASDAGQRSIDHPGHFNILDAWVMSRSRS